MRTLLVSLWLISGTAFAGITMQMERTVGDKTVPSTMRFEGHKVRIDFTSTVNGATGFVLWDGEARTLTTTRTKEKEYIRVDEASLKAQREAAKAKMEEFKARQKAMLDKLPPDQRARAEEIFTKQTPETPAAPQPTTFTSLKKSKKVGSWDCDVYEVKRGNYTSESCMVPWKKSPVSQADLEELRAIGDFSGLEAQNEFTQDLKQFPGFPIETVSEGPMGKSVVTLKEVKKGAIDAKDFTVPADFTEKKLPQLGAPPPTKSK